LRWRATLFEQRLTNEAEHAFEKCNARETFEEKRLATTKLLNLRKAELTLILSEPSCSLLTRISVMVNGSLCVRMIQPRT
jgi:hypothetical protein